MKNIIIILFVLVFADVLYAQTYAENTEGISNELPEYTINGNSRLLGIAKNNNNDTCLKTVEFLYLDNEENTHIKNYGSANYVASKSIFFTTGFKVESGDSMHAFIISEYCPKQTESILAIKNHNLEGDKAPFKLESSQTVLVDSKISIYPNPAAGKLYIEFLEQSAVDAHVFLMDMRGQIIKSINTQEKNIVDIDLSGLSKGAYLVVIKDAQQVIKRKIIKS